MNELEEKVAAVLELAAIEEFIPARWWHLGRPPKDRCALAKAFLAKVVYNCPTTANLIALLKSSPHLRHMCGWETPGQVPSESTFSRGFSEFSKLGLPEKAHEALTVKYCKERLVGHVSRDASDIPVAEKAPPKPKKAKVPKKMGRPKKGEDRPPKEPPRLQKQLSMTLAEMLGDLPVACDLGAKRKDGGLYWWNGYKLHVDWADGEIPLSCILTSAPVHDSQAAIPLAAMTAQRVTSLYDLMDAAYDAEEILDYSRSLGHVPIVEPNPRRGKAVEMAPAERSRYRERSTAERGFSLLKQTFGGSNIRVRGHKKVYAHLMFSMLALAAIRLLNLVT